MSHLIDPALDGKAVVPSDSTVLPLTRALYVGSTGNVTVRFKGGSIVTFIAVPAGQYLVVQVDQVRATGTSAGSIVALL